MKLLGLFAFASFLLALVLGACAQLTPVAALHVVFAIGVLPLIFGAMLHFVPVLTRSTAPQGGVAALPFIAQGVGIAVVAALQGTLPRSVLHPAATLDLLLAALLLGWMLRRASRSLGAPHPGWRWYAASLTLLLLALAAVPLMVSGIEPLALRLFHLHANTVGFVGLAALGTLPVLLPTAIGRPDPQAAPWLRRRLFVALGGVLFLAGGSALWWPISLVGAALLAVLAFGLLAQWWRTFGRRDLFADGAAASLCAALAGYGFLLFAGVLHGTHLVAAGGMVLGFVVAFLFPLVTGALAQLLPVWRYAGPATPERLQMRARLVRCGRFRALSFFAGGCLVMLGATPFGALMAGLGLLLFAADLAFALRVPAPGAVKSAFR